MVRTTTRFTLLAIVIFGFPSLSIAEEIELKVEDVPAVVLATLKSEAKGAVLGEYERETKKGKAVYTATYTVAGKEMEITVDPDGKLISNEPENDTPDHDRKDASEGKAEVKSTVPALAK